MVLSVGCIQQAPTGVVYTQPPTATIESSGGVNRGAVPQPTAPGGGSRIRVLHASPDSMASNVTIYLDNAAAPVIPSIRYRQSVGYQEASAGAHSVQVRLPGFAADSPPVLSWSTPAFQPGRSYTVIAHGLASELAGPPVSFAPVEDLGEAPAPGVAQLRFFNALVGANSVDLCTAQSVAFQSVRYGTWGTTQVPGAVGRYIPGPPGAATFVVRLGGAGAPCSGQPVGTAQVMLQGGSNATLVAVGRIGRPAVATELLQCTDAPVPGATACTAVPLR